MSGLENGVAGDVIDVRTGSDSNPTDLCGERIGNVVAVQVERRDHIVITRTGEDLLEEGVRNGIFDDDATFGLGPALGGVGCALPFLLFDSVVLGPGKSAVSELALRELISPTLEGALGELHDIALVNQGHRAAVLVQSELDGGANKALGDPGSQGQYHE